MGLYIFFDFLEGFFIDNMFHTASVLLSQTMVNA